MSGPSDKHGPEASSAEEEEWEATARGNEAEEGPEAAARGNEAEEGHESDYFAEEAEEGDDTTDGDGTDPVATDGGSGGDPAPAEPAPAEKKKKKPRAPRKDRTPQVFANITDDITEVSLSGQPLAPTKVANGYSMQLGCLVRETVSINEVDLRSDENRALVETLIKRLHQRYTFPQPFNKKVDSLALTKMSTCLSNWKSRVKRLIQDNASWEEIARRNPTLSRDDYEIFKSYVNSEECAKWTAWGRRMQEQNIGHQHCGSGGYRGKQPTWDKEDREIERLGKENPWHKITDLQVRNFVRSRYFLDWKTGEFVTKDEAVKKFEKLLVRIYLSLLI